MPNKAFYLLSTWLLCAHMADAATTDIVLQQQLDALIHDAHADLPYQEGEMVWQVFYRDGKSVVMVYQDVSASSTRTDFDAAQLRQDMAPALCEQEDNRHYLQAGYVFVTQIQFKHSAPLRLSHSLADCVGITH
ncbi:hypothetical protein LVJ82_02835 [Vitreoscilla massiliensis]|uniref:TonB C-terminal domain-containing protein n=1 Tax=Vitreoscilla massiliensis TaxID=1689272 RepID=A0ABY4E2F9_9NEIS|nr:hypothetical protein [Vitreoscilla massiliensis]UOO89941.1 hypothetical protein LVJ82_02835 [Vitreoscilla massiliensis]